MNIEISDFYLRLKYLCEDKGKSINEIEKVLGYSRNVLHNYRYGSAPSGIRLIELSNYFGVTPEYLLGKGVESITPPTDMTLFFQLLNKEQKKELYQLSQKWSKNKYKKL